MGQDQLRFFFTTLGAAGYNNVAGPFYNASNSATSSIVTCTTPQCESNVCSTYVSGGCDFNMTYLDGTSIHGMRIVYPLADGNLYTSESGQRSRFLELDFTVGQFLRQIFTIRIESEI